MISEEIQFEGFDARSWHHLLSLFSSESSNEPAQDSGTVVVVKDDEERVVALLHSRRGALELPPYTFDLDRICREQGAQRGICVRVGALEELAERLGTRVLRTQDYAEQWLVFARIVRELQETGDITFWPTPLSRIPIPTPVMVKRALDVFLPDDHALVATLWEHGTIWTAVVLRRRASTIDLMGGPDFIRQRTGPLGGDWRRDYRIICSALADVVGRVHLGIFAEADTMRRLLSHHRPGAWARAVASREVIVHPTPPYIAVALGADAFRAAAKRSAEWLGGVDAFSALRPIGSFLRSHVSNVGSISAALGFDPLSALAQSIRPARQEDSRAAESYRRKSGPSGADNPSSGIAAEPLHSSSSVSERPSG